MPRFRRWIWESGIGKAPGRAEQRFRSVRFAPKWHSTRTALDGRCRLINVGTNSYRRQAAALQHAAARTEDLSMSDSRRSWWVVWALAVALGLRLIAAVGWQSHLDGPRGFGFPDSHSYWYLAQQIAHGEPYEFGGPEARVFRAPVYPLVLASLILVTGDDPPVLWARLVGVIFGTLAVGGVAWTAGHLFNKRACQIAAWMAACYPGAIGMSVFVLSEAVFVPLLVLQIGCWVRAWQAESYRSVAVWGTLAGIAAGLATLARPSWLLFTPLAVGAASLCSRHRRQNVTTGILMVTTMCLTMLPWWVRNYRVTGTWVPTTLQLGASLYDGLNPRATGASDMWFSKPFFDALKAHTKRDPSSAQTGFEVCLDRRLRDAAITWAKQHPMAVVHLAGQKFLRTWSPWPHASEFQNWPARVIIAVGYLPLLIMGLIGAVRYVRHGWPYLLCVLPAAYFTLLHMIFVGSIRYRQPAMMVMIILAAGLVVEKMGSPGSDDREGNLIGG